METLSATSLPRSAFSGRAVGSRPASAALHGSSPLANSRPLKLSLSCRLPSAGGGHATPGMSPSAGKPNDAGKMKKASRIRATADVVPKMSSDGSDEGPGDTMPAVAQMPEVNPEDFKLEPGELSTVNRTTPGKPADVFRCQGCLDPVCHGPSGCANPVRRDTGGYLKEILTARVYDVAIESPLDHAPRLSDRVRNKVLLKREDMQPVFSFKLRGAYNKMANMTKDELAAGVICSSAGNHAQGTALSARKLGTSAIIAMPETTPAIKVQSVKRLGGEVVLVGDAYDATQAYAQNRAIEDGRVFIPPFDDPLVIAGQGTVGLEILRQCPDDLHAIFVPIGGGGLIAGIAAIVKELRPEVQVIGVEPVGANAMAQGLARGERVVLKRVDGFADGVAVRTVGAECFRLCRELVDGVVLVSTDSICAAIKDVFEDTRSILEPAGALALAGAKDYLRREGLEDKTVVCVTSGANMNFDKLRLVSELADVGLQEEAVLATTVGESPGNFKRLVASIGDLSITEFKYRQSLPWDKAHILWSVSLCTTQGPGKSASACSSVEDLMERVNGEGMRTINLSDDSLVKMHLRHLVGGTASIEGEILFQFEFPEKPGALMKFLDATSPRWDITLFHYRYSGNRNAQVLIGLKAGGARDMEELTEVLEALGYPYTPVEGDAMAFFDMFMK